MNGAHNRFHQNLLIVANAGSGKTYRLVTRCIQILQRGAKPEHILALTFTRAAAAEFLQKLFERLAEASNDPICLDRLNRDLADAPPLDAGGCQRLLRQLVDALPRLSMGTLDQYFGRIVRAFPFELGLSREMELLDDADRKESQARALEELFSSAAQNSLDEFIEMLRQHSRNRADQSALNALSNAAESLHEKFIESAGRAWGQASSIWPGSCPAMMAGTIDQAARQFKNAVAMTNPQLKEKAHATIDGWLALAIEHRAPQRMNQALRAFLTKLTDSGLGTGKSGGPYIPVGQDKLGLDTQMKAARDQLFLSIIKVELEGRLASSNALYQLLQTYESIYHNLVRRAGRLTFTDLVILLAANQRHIQHQAIEYRLDGRYHHWLLDEFQDTSRLQWRVLEPLADEVICDPSGERSFFYVGDTKQAIYGWRGGDFELFDQVRERYAAKQTQSIVRETLSESWRSDRAIIEIINQVFDPARLEHPDQADFKLPEASVANWKRAWVEHKPRPQAAEGFVQFRVLDPVDDERAHEDAGQAALDRAVLEILREADPVRRGINCAIIVRTREMLDHYVALLRSQEHPVPVAAEGRINPCLTSPEGLALLALAKYLATPADLISRAHFLASPFGFLAAGNAPAFHFQALEQIAALGIATVFSSWVRSATETSGIDPARVEPFIEAVADYDGQRKPGENLSGLADFIEHRVQQDSETPGVVRVMTTHFSKGLGMDMVILPELGGDNISKFRDSSGITLHRNSTGAVEWGLSLPPEIVCAGDQTLHAAREHLRARQSYENFCVLYVGMTRAKHALYCLHARGKNFKHFGLWLERNFPKNDITNPDTRTIGDRSWYQSFAPRNCPGPVIQGTALFASTPSDRQGAPSSREGREIDASLILEGGAARRLGTEVHELLARIEWLGATPDFTGASAEAADLVRQFLASDRASFMKNPGGRTMLWRERAFDVQINGRAISGIFDRVHVTLSPEGRPVAAAIYDFKTDKGLSGAGGQYQAQLDLYRKAAAILLGLDGQTISAMTVPVRPD